MASGVGWLPAGVVGEIESAVGPDLTDGVLGAVVDNVAIQAPRTRQTEPSVTLFAAEPARLEGFAPITGPDGDTLSLAALEPGEVYLNADAADELTRVRATPSSSTPPASRSARPSGRSSTSRAPEPPIASPPATRRGAAPLRASGRDSRRDDLERGNGRRGRGALRPGARRARPRPPGTRARGAGAQAGCDRRPPTRPGARSWRSSRRSGRSRSRPGSC